MTGELSTAGIYAPAPNFGRNRMSLIHSSALNWHSFTTAQYVTYVAVNQTANLLVKNKSRRLYKFQGRLKLLDPISYRKWHRIDLWWSKSPVNDLIPEYEFKIIAYDRYSVFLMSLIRWNLVTEGFAEVTEETETLYWLNSLTDKEAQSRVNT